VNYEATGYPAINCLDIFQASRAEPGRIILDTIPKGEPPQDAMPMETTISITNRDVLFQWPSVRVVASPVSHGSFVRTVLEDSRWKLREVTLGVNYNQRDCNGVIYDDTEKTVAELVGILETATGLGVDAGTTPTYKPLADWRGKRADQCMNELLDRTGCRLVYNPVTQRYLFTLASEGVLPDATERRFNAPQNVLPRRVTVESAPVTHEKLFDCDAVVWDEDNLLEVVSDPEGVFDNWADIADARKRARYQHGGLRLWKPADENVVLLGRRALSVAHGDDDITYAAAVFEETELANMPIATALIQQRGLDQNALSVTAGGTLLQCEQPRLIINSSGALQVEAQIRSAYYQTTNGVLNRTKVQRDAYLDGVGELILRHEWIRPLGTTGAELDNAEWATLQGSVADTIAAKFSARPEHLEFSTIIPHGTIGRIGAQRYTIKVYPKGECRMVLAINYDPAMFRGI